MKKRIISMLLCICMVCTLLPVTTWAAADDHADKIKVAGTELTTTGYYDVSDLATKLESAPASPGSNGYVHWESTTGILTLYGATIDGGDSSGIYADQNFTIVLSENTVSTVTSKLTNALTCDRGSITIKGPGKLNATGATNGIRADYTVSITDGATVNVIGENDMGIFISLSYSYWDGLRIENDAASVTITGKTYGVGYANTHTFSPPEIKCPNVTVTGETAAFQIAPTLNGVDAKASGSINGNDPEPYNVTNLNSYKWFKSEALSSVPVTGVTVTPATLALTAGESDTLTANVAPDNATNKTVNWTSSNPAVATVDANGMVTAIAEGTATITATTEDGGKTATCTVTVNPVPHSYTAEIKKEEALKSEGNCRDYAVYYYSCVDCGKVENNDSHTFNGDKDLDTHVGGSHIEGASEPDHKTQTVGSTGATICDGCNATLIQAQAIQPDAHIPGNVWSNDETNHWHTCTVAGCGAVIESTKEAHSPDHQGGATEEYAVKCTVCEYIIEAKLNHTHIFDKEIADEQYKVSDATCMKPATFYKSCACGEKGTEIFENGQVIDHTEGSEWKSDKDNHWRTCTVAGCGAIIESTKEAHSPDHQGGATEEYAVKCTVCEYIIEAKLNHTHIFDKEVADEQYKVSDATCLKPATFYKSCACGEKGTEIFENGQVIDHTEGSEWKSDKNNHWHECVCGDKSNTAAHKDENTDGKCDVCAYYVGVPTPPADSNSPQTGDNTMLWLALLFVSGLGFAATILLCEKKVFTK